jgi:glycerophosphoryl diester phosphodiesterase
MTGRPVVIAHRGSRLLWPENTLEAYSAVVDMGVRHVETDVRITGDGRLLCLHDASVDRTTDGSGPVSSLTFSDLSELDAGYRHRTTEGFPFRGRGIRVPAFEELATSFPDVEIVVDLKTPWAIGELVRTVDRLRLHDRVVVGSFRDGWLAMVRKLSRGRIRISSGAATTRRWVLASRLGRMPRRVPDALHVPVQYGGVRVVDQVLIDRARDAGVPVNVWTVNDPVEMRRLAALGVDGLITDRPDLAEGAVREAAR